MIALAATNNIRTIKTTSIADIRFLDFSSLERRLSLLKIPLPQMINTLFTIKLASERIETAVILS